MVKKAVLGTLLVALIGVLVAGALIQTVDGTGNVAEARGMGQGRGAAEEAGAGEQQASWDSGAQKGGRGGNAQAGGTVERQYPSFDGAPEEWNVYEGLVIQVPAAGVDLVVETAAGEELLIGTGPGYMESQGFLLQAGEGVSVVGYWEDDEFKALSITRLADGETITLRDESGHPAWAGGGNRASEQSAATAQGGQGQGRGQGGGRGRGGQGGGQAGSSGENLGALPSSSGELSESEAQALLMALTDEYKAWSVYDQVIASFGAARPFTNIQKAEENHIAALARLFDSYGLDVPPNEWPGKVPVFDSLPEACEAGVQAEIDNAALYDELFSMVDNPDIVRVFTALQRASEFQHLPAFERCAP